MDTSSRVPGQRELYEVYSVEPATCEATEPFRLAQRRGPMNVTECILWKNVEFVAGPISENFELLETITETSHWRRYILRCRCCALRYFFEFHEEIDWEGGNDPQFSVWVPFDSDDQLSTLRRCLPKSMGGIVPRLCKDWPEDSEKPKIYWVTR